MMRMLAINTWVKSRRVLRRVARIMNSNSNMINNKMSEIETLEEEAQENDKENMKKGGGRECS